MPNASGTVTLQKARRFSGAPQVPGDKSISHRALILGALARGVTRVSGLLESADVASTRACLERLGVVFRGSGVSIEVEGRGMRGLTPPSLPLDCGNSGTTLRLLLGVLAAQKFESMLVGDASLSRRPMRRVALPLSEMGARIELSENEFAPLRIQGGELRPLRYDLPVASAQVKGALLLAGLFADGQSVLGGKIQSRDHSERMLAHFGVDVSKGEGTISIRGGQELQAAEIQVPGDFSTAAFWLAAASIVPQAELRMERISLNPTRLGFLHVLRRMGAQIETEIREKAPEPWGTLWARHAPLHGTRVSAEEVPELIDELPLLAVVATQAEGVTEVRGARELRVKESDRLEATGQALRSMGAEITLFDDGFAVRGPQKLHGARIETHADHRIAMAFSVAALVAEGETEIMQPECVSVSYPRFFESLRELCHE